ncbi:MAG: TetR/AcrR family transcriptional regulator [Deltaproteobacteria bacterium]|nr:TetR/AcrR family transcriptional regulator [Deltaproteobacteria bacterium]
MSRLSRREILQGIRTRSLLEATRKIIAAKGFDAVTMEAVASEAGITKGGVYLYFRNKDEMVLAAIEDVASKMMGEIEKQVEPHAPSWERLCQTIRAQLEIMERHQDLLRTLLLDRRLLRDSPGGKQSQRLLRYRRRHEAQLKEMLDEGVRGKKFYPMDTARAAFYINEMTISTAQRRMLGLSRSSLERDSQALLRFIALLLRDKKTLLQT